MNQAELEQTLRSHGYSPRAGHGSHIVWKHPERPRTIAYKRRSKNYRVPDAVVADVRRQINKN